MPTACVATVDQQSSLILFLVTKIPKQKQFAISELFANDICNDRHNFVPMLRALNTGSK